MQHQVQSAQNPLLFAIPTTERALPSQITRQRRRQKAMESRRPSHSPCGTSVGSMLPAPFVFLIGSIALSLPLTASGSRQGYLTKVLDIYRKMDAGCIRMP